MKTKMLTLLAVAALVAGCGGADEPADPPPNDRALTTSEAAPVTDAPSTEARDDVIETSAAPDVNETTKASGPPELPSEAQENSEAGAEAFGHHYVNLMNYAAMTPASGLLEPLATDDCETCSGFEGMMEQYVSSNERAASPIVDVDETRARQIGGETLVFLEASEMKPATLTLDGATATAPGEATPFTLVITTVFQEGRWVVSEIQVQQ